MTAKIYFNFKATLPANVMEYVEYFKSLSFMAMDTICLSSLKNIPNRYFFTRRRLIIHWDISYGKKIHICHIIWKGGTNACFKKWYPPLLCRESDTDNDNEISVWLFLDIVISLYIAWDISLCKVFPLLQGSPSFEN